MEGECQQVFRTIRGNFTSPNHPSIYPNNMNCHWSVVLPPGYRIKLFFPVLELEERNILTESCDYDWLAVYDGSGTSDTVLGRWCGLERPPALTSSSNEMLVVLSTDRNGAYRGFNAIYTGGKDQNLM